MKWNEINKILSLDVIQRFWTFITKLTDDDDVNRNVIKSSFEFVLIKFQLKKKIKWNEIEERELI